MRCDPMVKGLPGCHQVTCPLEPRLCHQWKWVPLLPLQNAHLAPWHEQHLNPVWLHAILWHLSQMSLLYRIFVLTILTTIKIDQLLEDENLISRLNNAVNGFFEQLFGLYFHLLDWNEVFRTPSLSNIDMLVVAWCSNFVLIWLWSFESDAFFLRFFTEHTFRFRAKCYIIYLLIIVVHLK